MTDGIANFLTIIRNGFRAGHPAISAPGSRMTIAIAEILKNEGFVSNYAVTEDGCKKTIRVNLKYVKGHISAIQDLQRVSTPGLRRYVSHENIPSVLNGLGIAILSTSKGVLTDRAARAEKCGGELLCKVW